MKTIKLLFLNGFVLLAVALSGCNHDGDAAQAKPSSIDAVPVEVRPERRGGARRMDLPEHAHAAGGRDERGGDDDFRSVLHPECLSVR